MPEFEHPWARLKAKLAGVDKEVNILNWGEPDLNHDSWTVPSCGKTINES